MQSESERQILSALEDIRKWLRVAMRQQIKKALEEALPDEKSRAAYQMSDGVTAFDAIRVACKMSPNALVALTNRCAAMGLMEASASKRRVRVFDLYEFGLLSKSTSKDD